MSAPRRLSEAERQRQQHALLMPEVEERYKYLPLYSFLLRILSGVVVIATIIVSFRVSRTLVEAAVYGVGGIVLCLSMFALAQLIDMQVSKEKNQRLTNELLLILVTRRSNSPPDRT